MIDRETVSRVTLFADLDGPHLEEVGHTLDDEPFPSGGPARLTERAGQRRLLTVRECPPSLQGQIAGWVPVPRPVSVAFEQ